MKKVKKDSSGLSRRNFLGRTAAAAVGMIIVPSYMVSGLGYKAPSDEKSNNLLRHAKSSRFTSYKGLVMCGYQGWFRAPGDGSGQGWVHYGRNGKFDVNHNTIDFWPDVSEYKKTYKTVFKFPDGKPAKVFSSFDKSTTELHFKWMKEYGIDGVFMQRFFGVTRGYKKSNKPQDIILRNALSAAKKYGRAIAVMYDLSGLKAEGEDCSSVIEDWKMLVDKLQVTNQGNDQTYLYDNGKPLVAIWGVGFPDRPYNIHKIGLSRLIDFLKNDPVYGGCAVMLGVPTYFRELDRDTLPDPYLHVLIKSVDIVMPWMVGRFISNSDEEVARYKEDVIKDITWCKRNGVGYVPVVYPGFSWANLSRNSSRLQPGKFEAIPRKGGAFYWDLIHASISAGAEMLYVAMFDEIDEGTAIFKISNNPPNSNKVHFNDLDGEPSDYYLWLTGRAAAMLRKEIPLQLQIPIYNSKQ